MYVLEEEVLRTIAGQLEERFPGRIVAVYAFGSRVRGDHGPWSDFDVLVVVKDRDPSLEQAVVDIFVEEELRRGMSFSPVIKDERSFARERDLATPFYQCIVREGVRI